MVYTLARLIERVRAMVNEDITAGTTADSTMGLFIDDAQNKIADIILDERPDILSYYFDLTATGALSYFIPDSIPFDYETILHIEDYTDSDSPTRTSATQWFDRMEYIEDFINPTYDVWSVRDQYLEFPDKPTNKTFRVWYTRRPVGLFYGTVAAGASTTVTFPASPTVGEVRNVNDYYNGMKVYISSGDVRTISDYVGSTRVATVSSAFGTTPTTSHTVSLLSPLPERYHSLIADVAARLIKIGNDDDDTLILRFLEKEEDRMRNRIRKKEIQSPEYVRRIGRTNN